MKLLPHSIFGPLGYLIPRRKSKEKEGGEDKAAPSLPPLSGKNIPGPSVTNVENDLPKPKSKDTSDPGTTEAAVKDDPTAMSMSSSSRKDGEAKLTTITTSTGCTASITHTKTVTSATVTKTVTTIRHDIVTITKTDPISKSTKPISTQHTLPAVPATSKKRVDPAIIISVVFGLLILGLLAAVAFLVLKCRRLAKAKAAAGEKTYAEEFEWTEDGRIVKENEEGKGVAVDEWGLKRQNAARGKSTVMVGVVKSGKS